MQARRTSPGWRAAHRLGETLARPARRARAARASRNWPPHSRLFLVDDRAAWVLSEEVRELHRVAERLGVCTGPSAWVHEVEGQAVFYADQFALLTGAWRPARHRLAAAYFHGLPGTGEAVFDECFETLRAHHLEIHRLQVSHRRMRDLVLELGMAPEKVFLIPIAVDAGRFSIRTPASRHEARARFGIPESAFVVGSMQKDGVGWGAGLEPKRAKGPDVLLAAIEKLKPRIPELFVLLSGPARGYVQAGLERLGVPYRHLLLPRYDDVPALYHALDTYLISSRDEGGPKALLESMASGVPVVTTRVGQAADLARHGENAWVVEVGDAEGLAHWAEEVYALDRSALAGVLARARATAEANTYEAQTPLWREFMRGFVALNSEA